MKNTERYFLALAVVALMAGSLRVATEAVALTLDAENLRVAAGSFKHVAYSIIDNMGDW